MPAFRRSWFIAALVALVAAGVVPLLGCDRPEANRDMKPLAALVRPGEPLPDLISSRLAASPECVRPGAPLNLTIQIPGGAGWPDSAIFIERNGLRLDNELMIEHRADSTIGTIGIDAPTEEGDHLFTLRGRSHNARVAAHAMVHVSAAGACAEGEVREVGRCVPVAEGHHIRLTRGVNVNSRGGDRYAQGQMTHPRAALLIDDVIVACMTDAIGLIPVDELPEVGKSDRSVAEGLRSRLVETLLEESGIIASENFLVLPQERIVITSSRGADWTTKGGLASWRLPPLDVRPLAPPRHISTLGGSGGFEGLTRYGDKIYAVRKPNAIAVLHLSDEGELVLEEDVVVPDMRGVWAIEAGENRLFVTDATGDGRSEVAAGRLHVFNIGDSGSPRLLGSARTSGTPRDVEVLGDEVVAVANGALGIDLFDVSDGRDPILIQRVETPGSTMGLSFDEGYLLVADWDSIRLYDASLRGRLRLLDGVDAFHRSFGALGGGLPITGLFAASFVHLDGGRFMATEFNVLLTGTIQPGAGDARLIVHDRGIRLGAGGEEDVPVSVRVSNGGRRPLDLYQRGMGLSRGGGPWSVAPGATAKLDLRVAGGQAVEGSRRSALVLHSNDPRRRRLRIPVVPPGGFQLGDRVPGFRLPMINLCADGSCPERSGCFDLDDEVAKGRPILLAAFASW
ncbi:MAG: hypothetical protein CME06_13920 [Gemmatimonadetes bacterium]|nr:hypothetical protein [Gemmatimonadota bacterium]